MSRTTNELMIEIAEKRENGMTVRVSTIRQAESVVGKIEEWKISEFVKNDLLEKNSEHKTSRYYDIVIRPQIISEVKEERTYLIQISAYYLKETYSSRYIAYENSINFTRTFKELVNPEVAGQ